MIRIKLIYSRDLKTGLLFGVLFLFQLTIQHEIEKTNLAKTIETLQTEKVSLKQQLDEEKRKIEDLVFNYEEESITKSEIQVLFFTCESKETIYIKVAFLL